MMPPGLPPERTIVVVDISWWLNKTLHVYGLDSMISTTVGKFCDLLRGETPWFLAVAADSVGPTWRHELTENMPEKLRYKSNRDPRPDEYHAVCNKIFAIIRMHRVPILYAEGWEADDVFAAAKVHAQRDGLILAMLSADKDLGQLCDETTFLWDGADRLRGPAEIEADKKHPVRPDQIADLLAIVGDNSDNIPGVPDLGPTAASIILRRYGTLANALDAVPPIITDAQIKEAERTLRAAKRSGEGVESAKTNLDILREERKLGAMLTQLQAHRSTAEHALRLTTLDTTCPIQWDLRALALGDHDVPALRRAYSSLGFTRLAAEVSTFPKSLPDWMVEQREAALY